MDGKPDGRFVRCRPFNAVLLMGGNRDVVAGSQMNVLILTFESQLCGTAQDSHPLGLITVIPETVFTTVTIGNDSFNPDVLPAGENFDEFIRCGRVRWWLPKTAGIL